MINWPLPGSDLFGWAQALIGALERFVAGQDKLAIGAVMEFYGAIPNGWLEADGSTFDGLSFPELAVLLGGTTLPSYTARPGCVVGIKAS